MSDFIPTVPVEKSRTLVCSLILILDSLVLEDPGQPAPPPLRKMRKTTKTKLSLMEILSDIVATGKYLAKY
jgi:hypothetical protein